MSGSTGDSEFCFSENFDVPEVKKGTTLSSGNKTCCFPRSLSKCFVMHANETKNH